MTTDIDDAWIELGQRVCAVCQLKTSNEAFFNSHVCRKKKNQIAISFNKKSDQYFCSVCKVTQEKYDITEHLQCHLEERPFQCSFCDLDFESKFDIFDHLKEVHPSKEDRYELKVDNSTAKFLETARSKGYVFITPFSKVIFSQPSESEINIEKTCYPVVRSTSIDTQSISTSSSVSTSTQSVFSQKPSLKTPVQNLPPPHPQDSLARPIVTSATVPHTITPCFPLVATTVSPSRIPPIQGSPQSSPSSTFTIIPAPIPPRIGTFVFGRHPGSFRRLQRGENPGVGNKSANVFAPTSPQHQTMDIHRSSHLTGQNSFFPPQLSSSSVPLTLFDPCPRPLGPVLCASPPAAQTFPEPCVSLSDSRYPAVGDNSFSKIHTPTPQLVPVQTSVGSGRSLPPVQSTYPPRSLENSVPFTTVQELHPSNTPVSAESLCQTGNTTAQPSKFSEPPELSNLRLDGSNTVKETCERQSQPVKCQTETQTVIVQPGNVDLSIVKHDCDSAVEPLKYHTAKDYKYSYLNIINMNNGILYLCTNCKVRFKVRDVFIQHIWRKHAHDGNDAMSSCSTFFSLSCPHLQRIISVLNEKSMGLFDIPLDKSQSAVNTRSIVPLHEEDKKVPVALLEQVSLSTQTNKNSPLNCLGHISVDPTCISQLRVKVEAPEYNPGTLEASPSVQSSRDMTSVGKLNSVLSNSKSSQNDNDYNDSVRGTTNTSIGSSIDSVLDYLTPDMQINEKDNNNRENPETDASIDDKRGKESSMSSVPEEGALIGKKTMVASGDKEPSGIESVVMMNSPAQVTVRGEVNVVDNDTIDQALNSHHADLQEEGDQRHEKKGSGHDGGVVSSSDSTNQNPRIPETESEVGESNAMEVDERFLTPSAIHPCVRYLLLNRGMTLRKTPLMNEVLEITSSKFYICAFSHCDYSSHRPVDFLMHNQNVHGMESMYVCFYCGFEGQGTAALLEHINCHLGHCSDSDSYSGSILNGFSVIEKVEQKTLNNFINLLESKSKDMSNVKYHCNMCLSDFSNVDSFKSHMENSTLKTYSCKYCRSSFLDSKAAEKHSREEHPNLARFRKHYIKLLCKDRVVNRISFSKLIRDRTVRKLAICRSNSDEPCQSVSAAEEFEVCDTKSSVKAPPPLTSPEQQSKISCTDDTERGAAGSTARQESSSSEVTSSDVNVSHSRTAMTTATESIDGNSLSLEACDQHPPQDMTCDSNVNSSANKNKMEHDNTLRNHEVEERDLNVKLGPGKLSESLPNLSTSVRKKPTVGTVEGNKRCLSNHSEIPKHTLSQAPLTEKKTRPRIFDLCAADSTAKCLISLYSQEQDGFFVCKKCSKKQRTRRGILCHVFFCQGKISVVNCPYNCPFGSELPAMVSKHIKQKHPGRDSSCKSFRCINADKFFQFLRDKTVTPFVFETACKPNTGCMNEMKTLSNKRRSDKFCDTNGEGETENKRRLQLSEEVAIVCNPSAIENKAWSDVKEGPEITINVSDNDKKAPIIDSQRKQQLAKRTHGDGIPLSEGKQDTIGHGGPLNTVDFNHQFQETANLNTSESRNDKAVNDGHETIDTTCIDDSEYHFVGADSELGDGSMENDLSGFEQSAIVFMPVSPEVGSSDSAANHSNLVGTGMPGITSTNSQNDVAAIEPQQLSLQRLSKPEKGIIDTTTPFSKQDITNISTVRCESVEGEESEEQSPKEENGNGNADDGASSSETSKVKSSMACESARPLLDETKDYRCQLCSSVFSFDIDLMKRHIREMHCFFSCGICQMPYYSLLYLKNHLRFVHNTNEPNYRPISSEMIFTAVDKGVVCDNDLKGQERENTDALSKSLWHIVSNSSSIPGHSDEDNHVVSPTSGIVKVEEPSEKTTQTQTPDSVSASIAGLRPVNECNRLPAVKVADTSPMLEASLPHHRSPDVVDCESSDGNDKAQALCDDSTIYLASEPPSAEYFNKSVLEAISPKSNVREEPCTNFKEHLVEILLDGKVCTQSFQQNKVIYKMKPLLKRKADAFSHGTETLNQPSPKKLPKCDENQLVQNQLQSHDEIQQNPSQSQSHSNQIVQNPSNRHESVGMDAEITPDAPTASGDTRLPLPSTSVQTPRTNDQNGDVVVTSRHSGADPTQHHIDNNNITASTFDRKYHYSPYLPGSFPLRKYNTLYGDALKAGRLFVCGNCAASFPSVSEVKVHYRNAHTDMDAQWTEQRTNVNYSAAGERLFDKTDRQPFVDRYLCGYCIFQSHLKEFISKHMNSAHSSMEYHYLLPGCDEGQEVIAYTEKCCVGDEDQPSFGCAHEIAWSKASNLKLLYQCHLCDMCLPSQFLFRLHLAKHSGFSHCSAVSTTRGLLLCATCGYVASSSGDLACHVNRHLTERRYSCSDCGFDDHHRKGVKNHIRNYHSTSTTADIVDKKHLNRDVRVRPKLVDLEPILCIPKIDGEINDDYSDTKDSDDSQAVIF